MTRPDAKWRRSTLQCVCLSVPISGWSQQSYVVPVLVCLSQGWSSDAMSWVVSLWVLAFGRSHSRGVTYHTSWVSLSALRDLVMLECSSRSLNIQLTYVNYLKYICESEFDLRESPDWLSQRKKGNLEHVVWLSRSLRTSLCRVTEYIVWYAPSKGPSSVRPSSQSQEHSHRHDWYIYHDHDRCICQ